MFLSLLPCSLNFLEIRLYYGYTLKVLLIGRTAIIGLCFLLNDLLLDFFETFFKGIEYFILLRCNTADLMVTGYDRLNHIKVEVFVDSEYHAVDDSPQSLILDEKDSA